MRESPLGVVLVVMLLVSLGLNVFTLAALVRYRDNTVQALSELRQAVANIGETAITTVVHVEQDIPVEATVPIDATFNVPVNTTMPLSTTVYTTINIPLLGPQKIPVPIEGELPLQVTLKLPIKTELPVQTTYHLVTDLPVKVTLTPESLLTLQKALLALENGLK